jgi:hypothetical protein
MPMAGREIHEGLLDVHMERTLDVQPVPCMRERDVGRALERNPDDLPQEQHDGDNGHLQREAIGAAEQHAPRVGERSSTPSCTNRGYSRSRL